jgi:mono/diheme cytochrome c family protein
MRRMGHQDRAPSKWKCIAILLFGIVSSGCGERTPPAENAKGVARKPLSRGEYLVENVGMCADCHTPRNEQGDLDRSRWLQGRKLDFKPPRPTSDWAEEAPALAGLPRLGDAAIIKLLETGLKPDGSLMRPPMPQIRLTHEDAVAVADYLKSLPPGKQ